MLYYSMKIHLGIKRHRGFVEHQLIRVIHGKYFVIPESRFSDSAEIMEIKRGNQLIIRPFFTDERVEVDASLFELHPGFAETNKARAGLK